MAHRYAEDDVIVNQETGAPDGLAPGVSRGLDGLEWSADKTLIVPPSDTCFDDAPAANASRLLRRLLRKGDGEALSCEDVPPFGQSMRYSYIKLIARLCPIATCAFNRFAFACRISCACTDASATTSDGSRLCTSFEALPRGYNIMQPIAVGEFRCTGSGCRPLPFAPSALAFWNLGLRYTYGPEAGFCRQGKWGECGYFSRGAPSKYIGLSLADGLWALALGFACVHARDGGGPSALARLAAFDPHDGALRSSLMACLREEVECTRALTAHQTASRSHAIQRIHQHARKPHRVRARVSPS